MTRENVAGGASYLVSIRNRVPQIIITPAHREQTSNFVGLIWDNQPALSLRQLLRDYPDSPFLFVSERGGPMTADTARKVIVRAGELAGLAFPVHPHQLRHRCGYYLAMKGHDTRAIQDYLGHVNIHHTLKYTALSSRRFEGFWID